MYMLNHLKMDTYVVTVVVGLVLDLLIIVGSFKGLEVYLPKVIIS